MQIINQQTLIATVTQIIKKMILVTIKIYKIGSLKV